MITRVNAPGVLTLLLLLVYALGANGQTVAADSSDVMLRTPKFSFQVGSLKITDSISLAELGKQNIIRLVVVDDSSKWQTGKPPMLESYTVIWLNANKTAAAKMEVQGSSFGQVQSFLRKAQAGDYIFFQDIQVKLPSGKIVFMNNQSARLY